MNLSELGQFLREVVAWVQVDDDAARSAVYDRSTVIALSMPQQPGLDGDWHHRVSSAGNANAERDRRLEECA